MMKLNLDCTIILDIYLKEVRPILEYGAIVFHSGLTQKLTQKVENVQKIYFLLLAKYLDLSLTYSECCILFETDFLTSRRLDLCYTFVKRNLADPLAPTLFEKRAKRGTRPNSKTYNEFQSRSSRNFSSPLNFLTRIANEICSHKTQK